jgi:2-polyprenyl-3-methyl-5-hydroxy-6-metoxy-1,4-benzoquinol methylase
MNCPICNNNCKNVLFREKYYFATNEIPMDFTLELCKNCSFLFQASAFTKKYDDISSEIYQEFYKNEKFEFPNRTKDNVSAVEMITKNCSENTFNVNVLEIGSNRGDLLYLLKEKMPAANILGIEPTKFNKLKIPTISTFFSGDLFANQFDIIIMQHVLEHIKDAKSFIYQIHNLLKENGLLFLEVPYIVNSLIHGIEDFLLEHVNYFCLKSISKLLYEFEIVDYQLTHFLKLILRKKNANQSYKLVEENYDIEAGIKQFISNKNKLLNEINELLIKGKKLIFYGVSYYFLVLFKELREKFDLSNSFYFDDNFKEKNERIFKLPFLDNFNEDCVVILCSNNYSVQETMVKKLSKYKGLTVIKPWSEALEFNEI